jgi:hypothetical protein
MESDEKIEALEDEIIELKYQLKQSKDKEIIYANMLSDIETSIDTLFKREQENERFSLGEVFNFRENMMNLKNSIKEFKRIYKLRF